MQRFLFILQDLLKCSLIYLIAFIWLRFFISSVWVVGIISFVITLAIEFISIYLKRKNKNKSYLKLKEKEEAQNMFLSLLSSNNYLLFFLNLAKSRHANSEIRKNFILLSHGNHKVILYPLIKLEKLNFDDIMKIYKDTQTENADKIVITCNEYDKTCLSFVKNLPNQITLIDKYETYSLLYKEYDFFPEITLEYTKESKTQFKDLIAYSFNKSRTKGYLLSAFIIFFPSLFFKLNIYYCIIGSILLLFALVSFINPKYNRKKEKTIL